ncbi:DUF2800 domain-containing protein [Brucella abortus]|uniref:DUF2800 domain-containing protein n=1 Tax=Brucella abortus TaxID=235 RepID=UPI0004E8E0B8|nr:DUF2800 domain-containing protein [Brucella abortus]KFH18475.1 hypothetical protein IB60_17420 [Brucella abortus LMN1]RUQ67365.1 DUF2800 domain-containing protein [Brucella abortus]RUQ78580.1 DUF2800 domain-containing protein [Brucella abortus]RUQ88249.1 DUF2800 domain-containing protein [Brucella abortus]RUQ90278.1 DUF2800 domain-containing protein [Brucella abortus]
MAKHARLSASQTKDWASCPGTIALKEHFPYDDPSGEAAMLGTCAHALIERCLEEGVNPVSYKGRLIEIIRPNTDEEGTSILRAGAKWPKDPARKVFEVDDDMVEATTSFCHYVRTRLCELLPSRYQDADDPSISKDAVERGTLKLEGRVNPLPGRDDTGGTADVTIDAWPEVLEVIDYKNGSGVFVPIHKNWQLRSYLLGRAVETDMDYSGYRYAIGQPRHHLAPQPDGISWEDMTPDELVSFRDDDLVPAVERVDRARAVLDAMDGPTLDEARAALYEAGHLTAGEDGSHCTYCVHLTDCPAARARVEETIGMDFADDPTELEPPTGVNHLSVILPWKPFIETFLKQAAAKAEELLMNGTKVPGYKIVKKSGNRTWKPDLDEASVRKGLASKYGVDPSKLMTEPVPPKLITGPQAEKLVPAKRRPEFEEEYLYKPDGGFTMVPESDKREAVDPTAQAADDFAELD